MILYFKVEKNKSLVPKIAKRTLAMGTGIPVPAFLIPPKMQNPLHLFCSEFVLIS
jgi:hypothetical protein